MARACVGRTPDAIRRKPDTCPGRTSQYIRQHFREALTPKWHRQDWVRAIIFAIIVIALWAAAALPSSLALSELFFFVGPGIVIAVATSWAANAFSPNVWTWYDASFAALIGATILPPLVGLFLAWSTTFRPSAAIILLVLGSWCGLAVGLSGGFLHAFFRRHRRRRSHRARTHATQ